MSTIGNKLRAIYDGKEPPLQALKRLAESSSTMATAYRACTLQGETRNILAQFMLNCYAAGFVAGVDHVCKSEIPNT